MNNKDFCHLHVHNHYSLLDGFGTADQYCKRAKKLGFEHIALTNHGNVDGVIRWQQACEENNIHSIIGCEAYIVKDLAVKQKGDKRYHITLLVKNEEGWKNLLQLLTYANIQGFYYRPRIDLDLLLEYCEGLIIMTACSYGILRAEWGLDLLLKLKDKGLNVYAEIMPLRFDPQDEMNQWCLDVSEKYNIPLVATNDCHYILEKQSFEQEVLLAIQKRVKWKDPKRWKFDITGLYLKTANEMIDKFKKQKVLKENQYIKALKNTISVANKCDFYIEKREVILPNVAVPKYKNYDEKDQLINLSLDGLEKKIQKHVYIEEKQVLYHERLEEELTAIINLGFSRYFLIVWELINWCKKQNIMTGPCRGSVGGCLVAYCLGITSVDPIKYDLIFSRFISPARIDLPDIDMDFEDAKRGEIRKHLEDLYGKHNVAGVSTFLKMHGRGAVRDIGRIFDLPKIEVDAAAKSIVTRSMGDLRANFSIKDAFETFEDGIKFYKKYPKESKLAMAFEGQIRGAGQHAAAMCVSGDDLRSGKNSNYVMRNKNLVCNWNKEDAEYMGLMKLDVLGLNTLTTLNKTKILIKINHNIDIDFELIPLDDNKVFEEFTKGNNIGIFQLGSPGMIKLCREIKIEDFEGIVAINALHRPGTLRSGMVTEYTLRKHGEKKFSYFNDFVKNITQNTFGIILYQEQVIRIFYELAGLPWRTADGIRKVISKGKGIEEFKTFEKKFVQGCVNKGTLTEKQAQKLFDDLKFFGNYGFNKAHSVGYSLLAYWGMWFKVHYPAEAMVSLLSFGQDNKKYDVLNEAKRLGLKVVLPNVNKSKASEWGLNNGNLIIPFKEMKGIGFKAAQAITKERKENGLYKSFEDFEDRLPKRTVNKRVKKTLMGIGVFSFDGTDNIQEDEEKLEELSQYFNFELSNDPMFRFKKVIKLISQQIEFTNLRDINPKQDRSKKIENFFGRMTALRFGYREAVARKDIEVHGVADQLGGVYGNYQDKTDFMMLVFGPEVYQRNKYLIEHCDGEWLLVKANYPYRTSSIHAQQLWTGDDILTGNLGKLGLELVKQNKKDITNISRKVSNCSKCSLRKECTAPVSPSNGQFNIMAIGEAPGRDEDGGGEGFIGSSGKLLFKELKKRSIERKWLYVTNACKCWPSKTKTPKKVHVNLCGEFLKEEIEQVKPFVIFALGNTCNLFFNKEDSGIMALSGTTTWSDEYECWICWGIHPAMALYRNENKKMFIEAVDNFVDKIETLGFGL